MALGKQKTSPAPTPSETPEAHSLPRTFLCVVDESEELHQALRYACRRARSTKGRVALLYVVEPVEFQHWMAVGHLMEEERREQAEEMLQVVASVVQKLSGATPIVYIREGNLPEELMKLVAEEEQFSILVLGASTGREGPGRLITHVMKRVGKLPIPVTIVPGGLTDQQIDTISA
ncbi:MAG: universal stress protein [Rhodospirillales bacterium]|nr:MAG: universal stress protein [Rhodospirillales bacterium]